MFPVKVRDCQIGQKSNIQLHVAYKNSTLNIKVQIC